MLKKLVNSFAFRVFTPFLVFVSLVVIALYLFTSYSISDSANHQIKENLNWLSRSVLYICDTSVDKLFQTGNATNEKLVRLEKVSTMVAIEDFVRANNVGVVVYDNNAEEVLVKTELPKATLAAIETSLLTDNPNIVTGKLADYIVHSQLFQPWQWRIILLKPKAQALRAMEQPVYRYAFSIALITIVIITGLMFYFLSYKVRIPINRIIGAIKKGNQPSYRGVSEFEFLSDSIAGMMHSLTEKTHLLESTNKEIEKAKVQLSDAIESMSEGFVLFDEQDHLILCNQHFRNFYSLTLLPDQASFQDILRIMYREGVVSVDVPLETWIKSIMLTRDKVGQAHLIELNQDRFIEFREYATSDSGVVGIHTDITDRKMAEQRLQYLASYDLLTNLPNRVMFQHELKKNINRAERFEGIVALFFIDLDKFKDVNDTLGHMVGDELLKKVADILLNSIRGFDIAARLGGDEFAVISSGLRSEVEVENMAQRMNDLLNCTVNCQGHTIHIGASIGVTLFPYDGNDCDQLLKNADMAMYEAKNLGRNQYRMYNDEMNRRVQERNALEKDMRRALMADEFIVYYQPKIDLNTSCVVGMEALVRWQHSNRGLITPNKFIPIAEQSNLITDIGEWVLEEACRQCQEWSGANQLGALQVAVNLSASQFKYGDITGTTDRILQKLTMEPGGLEVEITETMVMNDADAVSQALHHFARRGVSISIDDFGTGYSSLAYLWRFPVNKVKIDRSFIKDLLHNNEAQAIVRSVISLAHSLNLVVIAEGVETKKQLEFLQKLKCDQAQGYFFTPPLPAEGFVEWVKDYQEKQAHKGAYQKVGR
ncbi:putative bifunctional diguanylate cyclase/phosphodiesterase [Spartinivicinus poritis]|uniref:EAL domain-containing protein n=1 Tax=Spartinivicinus poritis TaxID=2994640 RepID=A0ABT5U525_9GAMM|nr:EAL domain-containing protein [Spartinivicinus sp. A2-2]MDE1461448.1 EAL domain-containing protein [Spartinivicinus sp. A2-2]